jgi:hypothetical protein
VRRRNPVDAQLAGDEPASGVASLASLSAYFPLINTALELPVEVGPDVVTFGVRSPNQPAALTREYVEYVLAAVFVRTRRALGIAKRWTGVTGSEYRARK